MLLLPLLSPWSIWSDVSDVCRLDGCGLSDDRCEGGGVVLGDTGSGRVDADGLPCGVSVARRDCFANRRGDLAGELLFEHVHDLAVEQPPGVVAGRDDPVDSLPAVEARRHALLDHVDESVELIVCLRLARHGSDVAGSRGGNRARWGVADAGGSASSFRVAF